MIEIQFDLKSWKHFQKAGKEFPKQINYAVSRTVNRTAFAVRRVVVRKYDTIFSSGSKNKKKKVWVNQSHKKQLVITAEVVARKSAGYGNITRKRRKRYAGRSGQEFRVLYKGESRNPNLHRGLFLRIGKQRLKKLSSYTSSRNYTGLRVSTFGSAKNKRFATLANRTAGYHFPIYFLQELAKLQKKAEKKR